MKFLNHLNINEHELRAAKMYRASSGTYTPAVSTAGNIILDTSANIPKWWDGSAWRDFSFGTTGTMNWNIQSDGGSNIQVDNGDTLDLTGGTLITTATSGSGSAPVVTISHDNVSRSNTSATKTFNSGATDTLAVISSITTSSQGHVTAVETTTMSNPRDLYNIGAADSTTSPTGEAMIVLQKTIDGTTTTADQVRMRDGTYVEATVINAGTIDFDLSAVDGTADTTDRFLTKDNKWAVPSYTAASSDTTYTLPVSSGGSNTAVATLTPSSGTSSTLTFAGTANEIAITESTGNNGTITIGMPDDVVITGNLTVNGTTTTVNSNTVNIGDNTIVLNSDETGTPSQNGGIEIERGTSTNVNLLWNEGTDKWTVSDGSNSYNIIQDLYKNFATDSGTATANSVTDTLTLTGSGGISTSRSGDTITITAAGSLGQQNLYATFTGDSGSTTANSATDTLDIEGGTGISTTATTDKVTVAFDADNCGLNIFKTVRPRNTNNAGTVTNGTSAVADAITDTLDIKSADESIVLSGGDDFIGIKGAVKTVAVDIDVSSLTTNKKVHINHGFGTKDLIVQLWQKTASGKNENVMAGITTVDGNGDASTNHITIQFDYVGTDSDVSDGDADVRCVIMASNHITAAGAAVTYS